MAIVMARMKYGHNIYVTTQLQFHNLNRVKKNNDACRNDVKESIHGLF
jgi:hypothetical protein